MLVFIWSYAHVYDLHVYDSYSVYDTHIWVYTHMTLIYESVSPCDAVRMFAMFYGNLQISNL